MLEARRVQFVPPPEISACELCGARYLPDLEFVSFDDSSSGVAEDVPAGAIETVENRPGVVAHKARDAYGRGTTTIEVSKRMVCSQCLQQGAELVGYGDLRPLRAELEEKHARWVDTDKRLEASERERVRLERTVQSLEDRLELKGGRRRSAKAA
jgi:hypothetical protein